MNFCIAINHQSWTGYYQSEGLMFKSIQERKLFEVNIKHIILGRVSKAKGGEGGWRMGRGSMRGGVQERPPVHIRIIVITHQVSHSCIQLTSS